jgi:hypothetical protein
MTRCYFLGCGLVGRGRLAQQLVQARHLAAEVVDLGFQDCQAVRCRRRSSRLVDRDLAGEQVRDAAILLAGLAREPDREGLVARSQRVDRGVDLLQGREGVQSLGPGPQLAHRLRPAQHQDREHGDLGRLQPQHLVEHVAVLGRAVARAVHDPREPLLAQGRERIGRGAVVVVHHGRAVRRLVARRHHGVERERVGVRDGQLLLDQAAGHAQPLRASAAPAHLAGARGPPSADGASRHGSSTTGATRWPSRS